MNAPLHRAFVVQVKDGSRIVHEFGAMGPDSVTVAAQHGDLADSGQFVRVSPLKAEPFPVMVARNELAQVELEEAAKIAADLDGNVDKASKAHARNDAAASAAQMQWLDAMRCRGAL